MTAPYLFSALDAGGYSLLRVLLSILWQSTILLTAAAALVWMLRNRGNAVRHAIWTAAVLALPLLPLLSLGAARFGAPRAEIAVMPVYQAQSSSPAQTLPMNQPVSSPLSPPVAQEERASAPIEPPFNPLDYPWALGLSGYLFAVAALLFWMLAGQLRIRRWLAEGEAVIDSRVLAVFHRAGEQLGLPREIPVLEHPGVPAPMTCRIRRPVVILPAGFTETLSDDELRAVAFHELAHVRRRDTLVFSLAAIIRALYFFHPFVWYAVRQVSYLAELACDSAALDHEGNPAAYAELLTRIAFRLPDRALSTEMAAGILLSNSAFFRRVREILSDRSESVRKLSRWALAGIAVAGALCLLVAAALPLGEKGTENKTVETSALNEFFWIASFVLKDYTKSDPLIEIEMKIKKAHTPEKREAIAKIRDVYKEFRCNGYSLRIIDYILIADRNVQILENLAENGIRQGGGTLVYISLAKQALRAPLADKEFLQLAEIYKANDNLYTWKLTVNLAKEAANAKTEAELKPLREKIAMLGK